MRLIAALVALGVLTLPAVAAPTAAQKAEFYSVCMGIALIDERMMGYVIAGMKGGAGGEPEDVARTRARYIQESNRACGLSY